MNNLMKDKEVTIKLYSKEYLMVTAKSFGAGLGVVLATVFGLLSGLYIIVMGTEQWLRALAHFAWGNTQSWPQALAPILMGVWLMRGHNRKSRNERLIDIGLFFALYVTLVVGHFFP